MKRWLVLGCLLACGSDQAPADGKPAPAPSTSATDDTSPPPTTTPPPAAAKNVPLAVKFLGVGGFLIESGSDTVLTAPFYTRPSFFQVLGGQDVTSNDAIVAKDIAPATLASLRVVLAGHAHYDHLLDVPGVLQRATQATLYSNLSARNLLAAYAPDRAPACDGTPAQTKTIARSRVIALDDPSASVVDYRACPEQRPANAPLEGKWVNVPGTHVRILAMCSSHPDQFGPVHFGPGDVDTEQCVPPKRMDAWKEGRTLAFLVDFLDEKTGAPSKRVYYQDSPSKPEVGMPPASMVSDKKIDLAILCVGASNASSVQGAPENALAILQPRFAIGGHWEDFLRGMDEPAVPIAFHDIDAWTQRARTALGGPPETSKMKQNGAAIDARALAPQPGDQLVIDP